MKYGFSSLQEPVGLFLLCVVKWTGGLFRASSWPDESTAASPSQRSANIMKAQALTPLPL